MHVSDKTNARNIILTEESWKQGGDRFEDTIKSNPPFHAFKQPYSNKFYSYYRNVNSYV